MIAKIAVSAAVFAIDKPYSYGIPDEMTLAPGQRVTVPFGRGKPAEIPAFFSLLFFFIRRKLQT